MFGFRSIYLLEAIYSSFPQMFSGILLLKRKEALAISCFCSRFYRVFFTAKKASSKRRD
jgi:hypothetical protein